MTNYDEFIEKLLFATPAEAYNIIAAFKSLFREDTKQNRALFVLTMSKNAGEHLSWAEYFYCKDPKAGEDYAKQQELEIEDKVKDLLKELLNES